MLWRWKICCYSRKNKYSEEGENQTESTLPSSVEWNRVCYGNDKFVAIGYNSTVGAYSTDRITWTEISLPSSATKWASLCYGNDKFVIIVYGSTVGAYSEDEINWTTMTISKNNL